MRTLLLFHSSPTQPPCSHLLYVVQVLGFALGSWNGNKFCVIWYMGEKALLREGSEDEKWDEGEHSLNSSLKLGGLWHLGSSLGNRVDGVHSPSLTHCS
jgi:hypothetical protein